jgi:hypothetical protein
MAKNFKNQVAKSFSKVKGDMTALYEHVRFLYSEVERLQISNDLLLQKVEELSEQYGQECNCSNETKKVKLVASKTSTKLHDSECVFAKNINSENMRKFKTQKEALKQGLTKCKCLKN